MLRLQLFMDQPDASNPHQALINQNAYNALKKNEKTYWKIVHSTRRSFQ